MFQPSVVTSHLVQTPMVKDDYRGSVARGVETGASKRHDTPLSDQ
jgi:hypothetical protein